MRCFREGKKDVMVATDVASKGLDFPDIQHVINFDMPEDIENYGKAKPSVGSLGGKGEPYAVCRTNYATVDTCWMGRNSTSTQDETLIQDFRFEIV